MCCAIAHGQYHIEKIYIHFDKPYYLIGETCWYKAYVIQGNDLRPSENSGVLYVDWINPSGEIIKHQKMKVYSAEADGDFTFIGGIASGQYTVRAYTNLMRNDDDAFFFTRSLTVFGTASSNERSTSSDPSAKIDLQFFRERGTAINGLQTQLAFKAIDHTGKGINVAGQIVDENDFRLQLSAASTRAWEYFHTYPLPVGSIRQS